MKLCHFPDLRLKSTIVVLLLSLFLLSTGNVVASTNGYNIDKNGVALGGYDPVSYFTGKPVKGNSSHIIHHFGIVYYFSSNDNKIVFQASPQNYLPAYGGWCAWAMLDGEKVSVDPETFKIIDGVNYLFYNGFWGNTLKQWNERAAKKSEQTLVKQATDHWLAIQRK